jgi:hypothetical protein
LNDRLEALSDFLIAQDHFQLSPGNVDPDNVAVAKSCDRAI